MNLRIYLVLKLPVRLNSLFNKFNNTSLASDQKNHEKVQTL